MSQARSVDGSRCRWSRWRALVVAAAVTQAAMAQTTAPQPLDVQAVATATTAKAPNIPLPPPWPPASLTSQIIDTGYAGYHQMLDLNGDNRPAFCRFVGDAPNGIFLSCQLGSAYAYLSKAPYGMNSAKGVAMGVPPWGMLNGSSSYGPRFCTTLQVPMKGVARSGASVSEARLMCIAGTPPISGQVQKFTGVPENPCPAGAKARLLTENDSHREPYLYCSNSSKGIWSAQREDPAGITWQINGLSERNGQDGSVTTMTLIRQLTSKSTLNEKPLPVKKIQGGIPINYAIYNTVYKDGSTKRLEQGSGIFDNATGLFQQGIGLSYDIETDIVPHGAGYAISVMKESCSSAAHSCTTISAFKGDSADGISVAWANGKAPTPSDLGLTGGLLQKFSAISSAQREVFTDLIAKSDATLAAKAPANWSAEDINKIVNILTAKPSADGSSGPPSGTVTADQLVWWGGIASWHVTAALVGKWILENTPSADAAIEGFEEAGELAVDAEGGWAIFAAWEGGNLALSMALEAGNLQRDADLEAIYAYCKANPGYKTCKDLLFQDK